MATFTPDSGVKVAFLARAEDQEPVNSPCRLHRAVQPTGVTWTTMRRAHSGQ
jgi:hypothetical protein